MFTTHKTNNGFGKAARILITLMVIMGLVAFTTPGPGVAASAAPQQAAGILQVHVTNYQHGNPLAGAWVRATNLTHVGVYNGLSDKDGIARIKLPAGIYRVTVGFTSNQDLYEPWSQNVSIAPDVINPVATRLLLSSEMYRLNFATIDAATMGKVTGAHVRISDNNGQTISEGVTNKFGSFAARAPEGIFIATVSHPQYEAHTDFVKFVSGQPASTLVGLAPMDNPSMGDMQIHAFDAATGAPILGATLTVYNTNGKMIDQGMTDKTGTYYTCLPESKYIVQVMAPMYVPYSGTHSLLAGTLTHYKVLLVSIFDK